MQQLGLIQSGCQQWIRQPAAVQQAQFALTSSLAVYIHDADDYRLLKILAQHDQHLNAVCWSPVDARLLACATSQQIVKVYELDSQAVIYSTHAPGADTIKKLCWSAHDENILLGHAGHAIGSWAYKQGAWQTLHTFRAPVTCAQQSATETRMLAVGCADCSLHLYDLLLNKVVCTVKLDDGVVPCDLQFDPLSKQYLLVLCRNGASSIYGVGDDLQTLTELHTMAKQPAAERAAAFVPNQPGNFVSISNKTGVLQLWNVSQQQPLRTMRAGKVPAQSVQFLPGTCRALLTYQDGTAMVYDISTQEVLWSSQPGHTETIFYCCFAPHNPKLLATCSFDGTVRIWDTATGTCVNTLELPAGASNSYCNHNQASATVLYSVTWSPDGSQLAASSASGIVYLFDCAKGVLVKQWQTHSKMCLRVAWHPTEPKLLVSSGQDGLVAAFSTDGTRVKNIRHSTGMLSCAWHPKQKWVLATTSDEGPVYTWNLNAAGDSCLLQTLNGHTQKSFGVAWSPLVDNLLLSGSDDATARVWDIEAGRCCATLVGHRTEVRALCWHPEVPWLVFTGSWDATIRAWDIRSQQCIHTCYSHHGDVYGLSIHPSCPWTMASASRDTTIRLWDLKGLAAGLMVRCFLEGSVPRGQAEQYATQDLPMMCGSASQELANSCSALMNPSSSLSVPAVTCTSAANRIEFYQTISAFFTGPGAAHALWQLAAAVAAHLSAGQCNSLGNTVNNSSSGSFAIRPLPAAESCGFQHMAVAKQALMSAANQLELSTKGRGGGSKPSKGAARKEALHAAAMKHLQAGNVERCCDLLVEEEDWHTALALAPAVSQQYWRKLLCQRVDAAAKGGASVDELLLLLLVTGQMKALVEMLQDKRQYTTAANIAAVEACGGYQHLTTFKQSAALSPCALGAPTSPLRSLAATNTQPLSPTRTLSLSLAGQQTPLQTPYNTLPGGLSSPLAMQPTVGSAVISSPLLQRRSRNSLPPLRTSSSNLSPAAAPAAAVAADNTDVCKGDVASITARSRSIEALGFSAGAELSLCVAATEAGNCSPTASREGLSHTNSNSAACLVRTRTCSGSFGGCAVMDQEALAHLTSVRQAQALAYRHQGQPLLAACAHLTVNNIEAAIVALHLGNEPEQATTLALALGQLGGVNQQLLDRVYEALATKCEAAGDWTAAAAVIQLQSRNIDHQLELLAVRQERSLRLRQNMSSSRGVAVSAEQHTGISSLRQHMGSRHPHSTLQWQTQPLNQSYLLLADDHPRAAAKAAIHLQECVRELEQQVVLSAAPTSSVSKQWLAAPQALQQQQSVQQLFLWQPCLESLDAAALPHSCWHEVFSYILLAGSLKAFTYGYAKVGSYLMSTLRHWLEQHQVQGFPMCHAALLVLEAEALAATNPDAAWSLLIAAADREHTPENIRCAARQKLQSYPRAAAASDAIEAACVVAAGSTLPSRAAAHVNGRSAITGCLLSTGAVVLLDDESSVVSLSEAIMLSHVMNTGPHGTGTTLKLLT